MTAYYRLSCSAIFLLVLCLYTQSADSSTGDRDYMFTTCMHKCTRSECERTTGDFRDQPAYLKFLGWDCEGECQYICMWRTVELFERHEMGIPQFFGKWPFIRFAGLQEPASVIASILNLFAHAWGILAFRKLITADTPLYWFWHLFALVCMNGWIWSTIFHTRETPFTERMDYFSAFSLIIFSFFAAFVRKAECVLCTKVISVAVVIASYFTYHVYYLAYVKFDYGYNMRANIIIGVLNGAVWLAWCFKNRKTHEQTRKCALFILLALVSVALEVGDFPPIQWILDAHSLWHFFTAFITPLWYSFLIDDCLYLQEKSKRKAKVS